MTALDYYGRLWRRAVAKTETTRGRLADPFDTTAPWALDEAKPPETSDARARLEPPRDAIREVRAVEARPVADTSPWRVLDTSEARASEPSLDVQVVRDEDTPAIRATPPPAERAIPMLTPIEPHVTHAADAIGCIQLSEVPTPIEGRVGFPLTGPAAPTDVIATSGNAEAPPHLAAQSPVLLRAPRLDRTSSPPPAAAEPEAPSVTIGRIDIEIAESRPAPQPRDQVAVVRGHAAAAERRPNAADDELLNGPTYRQFGMRQM